MATKTVTLGEVAAAMQANGLPKHTGWKRENHKGEIEAACAIAQAAIRLEIDYYSLQQVLNEIEVFNGGNELKKLGDYIISLNDHTSLGISTIGGEAARRVVALRLMPLTVTRKTYKVATQ